MATTAYQKSIEFLYGLQRMGIKLGLSNIEGLLRELGEPQRRLSCVHVAGSNGKGSTCAFLAQILREAGFKTGLYTSPHLLYFGERIKIDGVPIPRADVVRLTSRLKKIGETSPLFNRETNYPTYFEMVTALALQYFAEQAVDAAVIETGLGGRLDATNAVSPLLSIITNISLEHTRYLGDTIRAVAAEKAGIVKKGAPLLTAAGQPEALAVMAERCEALQSPFYRLEERVSLVVKERLPRQVFDICFPGGELRDVKLSLLGDFQLQNAALAVCGAGLLRDMGWSIGEGAVRRGLERTLWPGRMQVAGTGPYLILDGAHNPEALSRLFDNLRYFPRRRLIVVFGIMEDKEIEAVGALFDEADTLVLTRAAISRAAHVERLAAGLRGFRGRVAVSDGVAQALEEARLLARWDDLICVTGSLYVVGEAQAYLSGQPLEEVRSVQ